MKTIIASASILAGFASVAQAEVVPGWVSTINIAATATIQDESKFKENKTEEAHEDAIDEGKNSTRTVSYGTTSVRFGNREILQSMVEEGLIDSIKGWSLAVVYDEQDESEHLVAFKKGVQAVEVPEEIVSFDTDYWGGVFNVKSTHKFNAKKDEHSFSFTENYIEAVSGFVIGEVELSGIARGNVKESERYNGEELVSYSENESSTVSLSGAGDDEEFGGVVVEGRVTTKGGYSDDVSAYLPPHEAEPEV